MYTRFVESFILISASFLTSILSALVGMAGGITLLSIMTFFMPLRLIIPIHGMNQLVSNFSRAYFLRKNIVYSIFLPFVVGVPLGSLLAVQFLEKSFESPIPKILIALLIFYAVFKPKKLPSIKISHKAFSIVGFAAGFLGLLVGATGPFIAPFFLRDDLNKEEIIATKAAQQSVVHLVKIPSFLYLGFNYQEYLPLIVGMMFASVIGTKTGVLLLGKISEKLFVLLFKSFLVLAALRLLYKAFV